MCAGGGAGFGSRKSLQTKHPQPTAEVGWCSLPGHRVRRRLLSEVPGIRRQAPGAPLCQAASGSASGPSTACRLSSLQGGSDKAPRVPGAPVFASRGKRPQVRASRKGISLIKLWAGPHFVQRLQGKGLPASPSGWNPRQPWGLGHSTQPPPPALPLQSLAGHLSPEAGLGRLSRMLSSWPFQIRLHPVGKMGMNLVAGGGLGAVDGMQDLGLPWWGIECAICQARARQSILLSVGPLFPPQLKAMSFGGQ